MNLDCYDNARRLPVAHRMALTQGKILAGELLWTTGSTLDHCLKFRFTGDREIAKWNLTAFLEMYHLATNIRFYADSRDATQCFVLYDVPCLAEK